MSERYYAILGGSYLGLTNASTLLATQHGLDGRKIILIGEEARWHRYADHEMGQPACFLSLPGFQALPADPGSDAPMRSGEFSRILREPEQYLAARIEIRNSLVTEMDPLSPDAEEGFRLGLSTGETIDVERVDFCTGPGLPRVLEAGEAEDPEHLLPDWVATAWNRLPTSLSFAFHLRSIPLRDAPDDSDSRRPGQRRCRLPVCGHRVGKGRGAGRLARSAKGNDDSEVLARSGESRRAPLETKPSSLTT